MAQPGDLSLVAVDEHLEGTQIAVLDTADERDVVQRLLSPYVRTGVTWRQPTPDLGLYELKRPPEGPERRFFRKNSREDREDPATGLVCRGVSE